MISIGIDNKIEAVEPAYNYNKHLLVGSDKASSTENFKYKFDLFTGRTESELKHTHTSYGYPTVKGDGVYMPFPIIQEFLRYDINPFITKPEIKLNSMLKYKLTVSETYNINIPFRGLSVGTGSSDEIDIQFPDFENTPTELRYSQFNLSTGTTKAIFNQYWNVEDEDNFVYESEYVGLDISKTKKETIKRTLDGFVIGNEYQFPDFFFYLEVDNNWNHKNRPFGNIKIINGTTVIDYPLLVNKSYSENGNSRIYYLHFDDIPRFIATSIFTTIEIELDVETNNNLSNHTVEVGLGQITNIKERIKPTEHIEVGDIIEVSQTLNLLNPQLNRQFEVLFVDDEKVSISNPLDVTVTSNTGLLTNIIKKPIVYPSNGVNTALNAVRYYEEKDKDFTEYLLPNGILHECFIKRPNDVHYLTVNRNCERTLSLYGKNGEVKYYFAFDGFRNMEYSLYYNYEEESRFDIPYGKSFLKGLLPQDRFEALKNVYIIISENNESDKVHFDITIEDDCKDTATLVWLNRLGGMDYFTFKELFKESFSRKTEKIKRNLKYDYNVGDFQNDYVKMELTGSVTLNTGLIDINDNMLMKGLFSSPKVWLIRNNQTIPVLINKDTLDIQYPELDNMEYTFNVDLSANIKTNI